MVTQYIQPGHLGISPGTLGHILYSSKSGNLITEESWVSLMQSIAAGDQLALHALYERSHRPVFRLFLRITQSQESAEALTIDVFYDIWRLASSYDPANNTVLGWIMNLAQFRAMDGSQSGKRKKQANPNWDDSSPTTQTDHSQTDLTLDLLLALSIQGRLAYRLATETGKEAILPTAWQWTEPDWEEVSPGIFCKLLATDTDKQCVSMLVRLAKAVEYPPHTHAGLEELHLLDGELWINDRKLFAGDYNRAEPNTSDHRVWSRTGCMCVLITSTKDRIL